jgi:hypothetical protein
MNRIIAAVVVASIAFGAADAFGLMAVAYDDPQRAAAFSRPIDWERYGRGLV